MYKYKQKSSSKRTAFLLIFCCFQDLILSYPFDSRVFPQDFACLDSDDISDKPFVYAALWDYDNYTALFDSPYDPSGFHQIPPYRHYPT